MEASIEALARPQQRRCALVAGCGAQTQVASCGAFARLQTRGALGAKRGAAAKALVRLHDKLTL